MLNQAHFPMCVRWIWNSEKVKQDRQKHRFESRFARGKMSRMATTVSGAQMKPIQRLGRFARIPLIIRGPKHLWLRDLRVLSFATDEENIGWVFLVQWVGTWKYFVQYPLHRGLLSFTESTLPRIYSVVFPQAKGWCAGMQKRRNFGATTLFLKKNWKKSSGERRRKGFF